VTFAVNGPSTPRC
jgi:hypothetical protein